MTRQPVVTGNKLNVHKAFRRRPGRPLNVTINDSYDFIVIGRTFVLKIEKIII